MSAMERLKGWLSAPLARSLLPLLVVLLLGCVFHQQGAFFRWDGSHHPW